MHKISIKKPALRGAYCHYATGVAMLQRGLKPTPKIILYWLASLSDTETKRTNISVSQLAQFAEVSVRAVFDALLVLEQRGLIRRHERKQPDGGQAANEYELLFLN